MLTLPATQFDISAESPAGWQAAWLVAGVWADESYTGPAAELVAKLREAGDFAAKHLELVPVLNPTGVAAKRLLFVGLGNRDDAKRATLHDAASAAARHLS